MQILWAANGPVTSAYVQEQATRGWKMISVLIFLSRSTEKEFLSCEKRGKANLYCPLLTKEAYLQQESASFKALHRFGKKLFPRTCRSRFKAGPTGAAQLS